MAPVAATYFCYGWVLWLYLSWLPIYFVHRHHLLLKNSALFSAGVFLAGVAGDWLGGVITDRWARQTGRLVWARCGMVTLCMSVTVLSLLPLFLVSHLSLPLIALCLSLGLFFNELCIGPMWCIPMDIAPDYCGTASGVMNAGGAVAAILSPVVAGFLIDRTGNWDLPFICSIVITLIGAGLALTMRPESKLLAAA
jgi:MFS family permease